MAGDLEEAVGLQRQGALAEAIARYRDVLRRDPRNTDALHHLATAFCQQQQFDEGERCLGELLAIAPGHAQAHQLLARIHEQLGRPMQALESVDRAIQHQPDFAAAFGTRGDVLAALGRLDEALASYDRALALRPESTPDLLNRGVLLAELDRHSEALASYDQAIARQSDLAEAHHNRAHVLSRLQRGDEALAAIARALALRPQWPEAHNSRGVLQDRLGRLDEALASFEQALAQNGNLAQAHLNRGNVLMKLGRFEEASLSYENALAAQPDHKHPLGQLIYCKLVTCDWRDLDALESDLMRKVADDSIIVSPFVQLAVGLKPAEQFRATAHFARLEFPRASRGFAHPVEPVERKLRIAYVSADFQSHATMAVMAGMFEQHDRSRFETIAISYGADDGGEERKRAVRAFDQFHDVRTMRDEDASKLIQKLGVDIAVDLKGFTEDSRLGILLPRPAPIQVNYMGFPGTTALGWIDYVIADSTVLPFDRQAAYSEKIVHLPDSYYVTDDKRAISARVPSRREAGLPERGFVFCCFNNSWKVRAPQFDIWMRLLQAAPGSVLWLLQSNAAMARNLCMEASARNVDPARLVFAPRLPSPDHLARTALADLFLDTLPYNAHTTASEALWVGVPVVTCPGEAFSSRVASSLLRAVGLPQLVGKDLTEYEAIAGTLARDGVALQALRQHLMAVRATCPLFDTRLFCRHMERAYETMWQMRQRGEPPRAFAVPPER